MIVHSNVFGNLWTMQILRIKQCMINNSLVQYNTISNYKLFLQCRQVITVLKIKFTVK